MLYSASKKKKKGNPGLTPNFSKSKKDLTKRISVHDSIIILLSFGKCSLIFDHGWLHSNKFCKTCQNCVCPSWHCVRCMMAFAGAFTTKQRFMHLHCIVYNSKLGRRVLTCFTNMIAEQPSLTQYERPMYYMKEK